jgi:four helix bundle protein
MAIKLLHSFPKVRKFALAADIKRCMHLILERVIEANKKYYKKTTLQELDVEIMKLKAYLRLSQELGFLPFKKYEIWSEKVVEIGKMLGGWIKSTINKKYWEQDVSAARRLFLYYGRRRVFALRLDLERSFSNLTVGSAPLYSRSQM